MDIRPKRARLALCLSVAMLLAVAAPAAASTTQSYDWWPGTTPCTDGDYLDVQSYASGTVYHYVDGAQAGFFYNGSMVLHNAAAAPSYNGNWSVESWDGYISSAWADCWVGSGDDGDDDEDDGDGEDDGGDGGDGGGDIDPPPPPEECNSDDPREPTKLCPIE